MDTGCKRRKWKFSCVPCLLILLALLCLTHGIHGQGHAGDTRNCTENEYRGTKGICCDKCPPGFKLKTECPGPGLRSSCEKCSEETYIETTNFYPNCFSCQKCSPKNSVIVSNCTHERNTVCGCKADYFKKVINLNTWSCDRCKKCGDGERVSKECSEEKNTQCECKDFHYRVNKNTCASCKNCSQQCQDQCPGHPPTKHPILEPELPKVLIPIFAATTIFTMLSFVSYVVIRHWRKTRRSTFNSDVEKEIPSPPISNLDKSTHCREQERDRMLPDCVPREVKIHEFIYFVLEMVPVGRFKELARRLNVSEQEIDRAERDNCSFAEAQYQILKVWSDSGNSRGKNILPRSLLQEFVDRLKDMNLNGCAESIEDKFCTEA